MSATVIVNFSAVRKQMADLRKLASPDVQRHILSVLVERVAVTGESLVSDPPVPVRKQMADLRKLASSTLDPQKQWQ